MEKEKKETEEIIVADIEQRSANSASHEAMQNQESNYEQQEIEDSSPQCDRQKQPSHGAGNNEKQSQSTNLRFETLNPKFENRNNMKCPKNQILETNAKC
jgi:hypothetical protein